MPTETPHSVPVRERAVILSAAKNPCISLLLLPVLAVPFLFLQNISATSASATHGSALFSTNGCAHCHGPAGSGGDRGPDLKDVRRRLNAAAITTQIHDGGQSMPPFGDALTPQDITDLVAYLRARHKPPPPPPAPEPVPPTP